MADTGPNVRIIPERQNYDIQAHQQYYSYALDTLDSYDYRTLKIERTTGPERFHAAYDSAMAVIRELTVSLIDSRN